MIEQLSTPFAPDKISWLAKTVSDKGKALALAYIDARDVMERLDAVVGPENWQDRYDETAKGRVICTLSIRLGGEWIAKSDGSGDSDVEGEKGAISGAFKRAAVKWGIGRYLYDVDSPWAECELAKDRDGNLLKNKQGKPVFRAWTPNGHKQLASALAKVVGNDSPDPASPITDKTRDWLAAQIDASRTTVGAVCKQFDVTSLKGLKFGQVAEVVAWLKEQKEAA